MSTLVICSGQGSQACGLGKNYLEKHPELWGDVRYILEQFGELGSTVLNVIQEKTDDKAKGKSINRADIAHLLLFTIQTVIGLHIKNSEQYDISVVVGYSAGELSGSVISGILSVDAAIEILKARLVALKHVPNGKMLAILLPLAEKMPILEPGIEVAAINSDRHYVIAGLEKDMESYIKHLSEKGVLSVPVKSDFPFHHSIMNPAVNQFKEIGLKKFPVKKSAYRFVSSFDGKFKTSDDLADPEYWSDHPIRTLNLVKAFTSISQTLKPTSVIELGSPGSLAPFAVKSFSIRSSNVVTL